MRYECLKASRVVLPRPVKNEFRPFGEKVNEGFSQVTVGYKPFSVFVFVQLQDFVAVELNLVVGLFEMVLEHIIARHEWPLEQVESIKHCLYVVRRSFHVLSLQSVHFIEKLANTL